MHNKLIRNKYLLTIMPFIAILNSCSIAEVVPDYNNVKLIQDVNYLEPGRTEKLDLYLPEEKGGPRRPGIVIIHGGGWAGGDKFWLREQIAGTTFVRAGYVCASINYTLCDANNPTWPQNIYDCKKAVQFLRKNADLYNIDANNIGAIGGSAGGHLVSMLGVTGPDAGLEPNDNQYQGISTCIQAVVDMYGITDLTKWKDHRKSACRNYIGCDFEKSPQDYIKASPVTHVSKNDPPFLIIHGTEDTVVEMSQSLGFIAELQKKGVSVELVTVEGAGHAFHMQLPQKDLRSIVIDFFNKHLKNK